MEYTNEELMNHNITFDFNSLKVYRNIFVLVSGGLDSTLLYEIIKERFPNRTYPVNCHNPYENSKTLTEISKDIKFISVTPGENDNINYKNILKEAFMKLPIAFERKERKIYDKKVFPCCYHIKHKYFLKHPLFKLPNTIIISGIKRGDGSQRRIWLLQMSRGTNPRNQSNGTHTFYHRHKTGQLYCYPFRDYTKRELPEELLDKLYSKYPYVKHSGCHLCPVLVLFDLKSEGKRYTDSINYAKKLGVI